MKQVKTVHANDSRVFDRSVNAALADGFEINKLFCEGDFLYAIMVKRTEDAPIVTGDSVDKPVTIPKEDDQPREEKDSLGNAHLTIEMVDNVMRFIKWCCDHHDYCPHCPLYSNCHCDLPFNWTVDDEEEQHDN